MPCPDVTSVDVCDSPDGTYCFKGLFPWLGQRQNCVCKPVLAVPPPWDMIATIAIAGAVGYRLMRGVMR